MTSVATSRSGRTGRLALSCGLLLGFVGGCAPKDQPETKPVNNGFHPYGVRQGQFNFQYEGMERGRETLWIDSFGHSEARNTHSEQITDKGFKARVAYAVKNGAVVTIVDTVTRRTFRFVDPTLDSLYGLSGPIPNAEKQFADFFTGIGYKHVADTTIVGLPARVWKHSTFDSRLYEWRGLLLAKHTSGPNGPVDMHLVSFDTTTPVDRTHFVAPSGYPVVEQPPR